MAGTFWALVPPIVAIVLALITKETYSSLFIGILVGALFVGGFNPVASLNTMINDGFIGAIADGWNAGIFMFLVLLGIMVALVNAAGGSAAFGRWAVKHVHTRTGAMLATFLLGVLIFPQDLPRKACLHHRRHRRPRVHDRAGLLLGRRRLRHGAGSEHRHLRHPALYPGHSL